jgi:two-component system, NarL family, nitrate/nitrite response regulator NarL
MRLLICDDEAIFVEAMASVFCARGHVVVETTDVSALVERVGGEAFDVCLVDLFFSGCPSVDVIRRLLGECPDVATVVLTGYPESPLLDALRRFPSLTLLSKGSDLDEIVRLVELRAERPIYAGRWQAGPSRSSASPGTLTPREREVLVLLSKGVSTAELARRLGVRQATARSHVQSLLQKMGAHSRVEAVTKAMAQDLLTSVDLQPGQAPRVVGA